MPRLPVLFACLFLSITAAAPASADVLRLTTLHWPPYTGVGLPRLGSMTAVVSGAAARVGDRMELRVLPWKRAVRTGESAPGYAGYYPLYRTEERETRCHLSAPIGHSPLGLVEPADAPLPWETEADLAPYVIGTVEGYANTPTFDRLVAEGSLTVDPAVNDLTNLRKVLAGRIDAAVIDRNVMAYLVATTPDLRDRRDALHFNAHLLADKSLHVCFRRTDQGRARRDRFNRGLAAVDVPGTVRDVLDRVRLTTTDWLNTPEARP